LQSSGLIGDLFDVQGNRHALRDAAGQCTGLGSLGDARSLVQPKMNLGKNDRSGLFGDCAVLVALPFDGDSTAPNTPEVEQNRSNLVTLIRTRRSRNSQAENVTRPRRPTSHSYLFCGTFPTELRARRTRQGRWRRSKSIVEKMAAVGSASVTTRLGHQGQLTSHKYRHRAGHPRVCLHPCPPSETRSPVRQSGSVCDDCKW
jgi:hypothetical protein